MVATFDVAPAEDAALLLRPPVAQADAPAAQRQPRRQLRLSTSSSSTSATPATDHGQSNRVCAMRLPYTTDRHRELRRPGVLVDDDESAAVRRLHRIAGRPTNGRSRTRAPARDQRPQSHARSPSTSSASAQSRSIVVLAGRMVRVRRQASTNLRTRSFVRLRPLRFFAEPVAELTCRGAPYKCPSRDLRNRETAARRRSTTTTREP